MLDIDTAIRHCLEVAGEQQERVDSAELIDILDGLDVEACKECAANHRQLAKWLTELKEAKSIIRVCNRMLGFLLECEIENTSTRHEVETLLKNITEYLTGCGEKKMTEYISKQSVLSKCDAMWNNADETTQTGVDTINTIDKITDFIESLPPADVQPAKHGRWIIADDVEHFIAVCSECGRTEDSRDIKDMPYCHCGARMDGDTND